MYAIRSYYETTPVLFDIDLQINQGQTHALVGESGSGKSVTALSILRLIEETNTIRITSYNVCYTKLLRRCALPARIGPRSFFQALREIR